jgi:hypothetical protein
VRVRLVPLPSFISMGASYSDWKLAELQGRIGMAQLNIFGYAKTAQLG